MAYPKRSRKLLLLSTTILIISLASVLTVYASAILGTFNGNAVTVNDVTNGSVTYSTDGGSTWSGSPSAFSVGGSLYTRFELSSTSYTGSATVSWQLQKNTGTWTNQGTPVTTTVTLIGGAQTIYASADGTTTGNHNWGADITTGGEYRVVATVSTA